MGAGSVLSSLLRVGLQSYITLITVVEWWCAEVEDGFHPNMSLSAEIATELAA
jgi:hypothetical protein